MKCNCITDFETKYAEHFRCNGPDVQEVLSVVAGHMIFDFGKDPITTLGTIPVEVVYLKNPKPGKEDQKGARKTYKTNIVWKYCPICGMDQTASPEVPA